MEHLLLAPPTRSQLNALLTDTPHAVLLVGPTGIGKRTVAEVLAAHITVPAAVSVIEPDERGTISIEAVRTLYRATRSRNAHKQAVIIDHAEAMGAEAQNAFLKLLEEPPTGVTFILTAPSQQTLLPTIGSRVQIVALPRLGKRQLEQAVGTDVKLSPQELAQLLFVADGRPGTLMHLLRDQQAFVVHQKRMQQAKQLLAAKPYQRLAAVASLAKDKDEAAMLLEAMAHILYVQLLRSPSAQGVRLADALQETMSRLAQNGNPRAQLTALFTKY